MKIYGYDKCGTSRKAYKWLEEKSMVYEKISIRETPPSKEELRAMLEVYDGNIKKLFNTSGLDYRNGQWKDKISSMSEEALLEALSENGNLIKRPFVIFQARASSVGYNEELWEELYG